MPAALEYILDTNSQEYQALEKAHTEELRARTKRIETHWKYYDGDMHKPLKREQDGYDDNILLAKVDQIADKIVSFLIGKGLSFDAEGDGQHAEEDEQIKTLWTQNRQSVLVQNIALSGTLAGHVFLRVEPRQGQMPRIVNLNPKHCGVFWDIQDIERVLWYRLQYTVGRSGKRIDYVRGAWNDGRIDHDAEGWLEIVYDREYDRGHWVRRAVPTALDWLPIVDWQNQARPHEYYGTDDIRKAIVLNDAVNFLVSNYNRILKHHASPKTIGLGMDAGDVVASSIGGFWTVNKSKTDAQIYNLEMESDLASARELLSILLREIWQGARLVDPQTVKDKAGVLTNFAIRTLYADAISKIDSKRELYAEGFEQTIQRAMLVAGLTPPSSVTTLWPPMLPEDTESLTKALLPEYEAGLIDRHTYHDLRGLDHEAIETRLAEEGDRNEDIGSLLLRNFERGA